MSTPLEIRARRHMPPVQDDQYLIDLYLDEMIDIELQSAMAVF